MRLWFLLLIFCLGVTGCTRCSPTPPTSPELPQPHPVEIPQSEARAPGLETAPRPAGKPAKDAQLLQVIKLSSQADQILREAWWVLADERRPAPRSAFGKVMRAALLEYDGRLATKGIFTCDRYVTKVTATPRWQAVFSEACSKNAVKDFATWTFDSPQSARVEFSPQHLSEVLGLGVSVFGRKMSCQLRWSGEALLDQFSCPLWEQDRGHQVIHLDVLEYSRQGRALLKLKGKVLENLQAVKKIESEVPLEGKILVTETDLQAPAPVKPPAAQATVAGPGGAKPEPPPPGTGKKAAPAAASVRGAKAAAEPGDNADLPQQRPSQNGAASQDPSSGMFPPGTVMQPTPVVDPNTGQTYWVLPPGVTSPDLVPVPMPQTQPDEEMPPSPVPQPQQSPLMPPAGPAAEPEYIEGR